ncbi:MAG: hypothetical protein Q8L07_03625 [Sediminibacterium sp.]|nr:hypothetical protein [Sediminibacterium sp.]
MLKYIYKKIIITLLSLLLNTMIGGGLFYIGSNLFLARIQSFTLQQRMSYTSTFDLLLGVTLVFLIITYSLYKIIIFLFNKHFSALRSRLILGIITSVLPVIGINYFTFGFSLKEPVHIMELLVMMILGVLLPYTEYFLGKRIFVTKGKEL